MNRDECLNLLIIAASFDNRTTGQANLDAWYATLAPLSYARALDALLSHKRHSPEYLEPYHIWNLAKITTDGEMDRRQLAEEISMAAVCAHGTSCPACKAVHGDDEPCAVLLPAGTHPAIASRFRGMTQKWRATRPAIEAPVSGPPKRVSAELSELRAAAVAAEQRRQASRFCGRCQMIRDRDGTCPNGHTATTNAMKESS